MDGYSFTDCHGSFTMDNPNTNYLYVPLASERGLKSAITPDGGGDAKINQTSFLLEPESVENLHNNRGVRNFWVRVRDAGVFSALGASDMQQARKFTPEEEPVTLSAGFMWHSVRRTVKDYGVESTVTTCLSLLIMDPQGVGEMIEKNFGGVRMDGTNATIIGDGDGNFIADRNGIARVWMDHALWPLMTTKLYIDQTGDLEILLKKAVGAGSSRRPASCEVQPQPWP